MATHIPALNPLCWMLAAEDIELDAEPEKGEAGEMAVLYDTLTDARKKAEVAEKEAEDASALAEEKLEKIQHATLSEIDVKQFKIIKKEALDVKQKAVQAARKAAKASVKADDAEKATLKAGVKLMGKGGTF